MALVMLPTYIFMLVPAMMVFINGMILMFSPPQPSGLAFLNLGCWTLLYLVAVAATIVGSPT